MKLTQTAFTTAGLGILIASGASAKATNNNQTQANSRPNILFMIADDWGFPHAGAYGDKVVKTPTFDRMAAEGILFTHAFCAAPSCTPSRAAILTGQYPHRLGQGGNLWSTLDINIPTYVRILEANGYHTGKFRKAWGPGNFQIGGYEHDPGGINYPGFQAFYDKKPSGQPFCFWFGSSDPHRPYEKGSGENAGMKPGDVKVPAFMPDNAIVRGDILDYYFEVNRFDRECGEVIEFLRQKGELENTIIVMTGDNGMPFPRAKANLYDYGTHIPLVIRWGNGVLKGYTFDGFVNLMDMSPTFIESAGLPIPADMTGRSLFGLLKTGKETVDRSVIFLERERHANVRALNQGYPARAVRTKSFLYIRNYRPDRWPAGDPSILNGKRIYGDVDDSPSKTLMLELLNSTIPDELALKTFGKRPKEELYDVVTDPYQLKNLAEDPKYGKQLKELSAQMDAIMQASKDPRVDPSTDVFDKYPYYGNSPILNERGLEPEK